MVREARREFFSKHSYNFTTDGTSNHSGIFRWLSVSANLLGTSIHEIQMSWTGPKELKQANCALQSLPKDLKFLCMVPPSESPKVMGLTGIHDPDTLCHFGDITYCLWCGKEGQNEGTMVNHLWTMHYRLAWCTIDAMVAHPQCPTPSAAMASMTAANPGRMIPLSQFHAINFQESTTASAENPNKEVKAEWPT